MTKVMQDPNFIRKRLADFSLALAGNWSAEECDKWFDFEAAQGPDMSM